MTPTPRGNGPLGGASAYGQASQLAAPQTGKDGRSVNAGSFAVRGQSYAPSTITPGSFATDFKSTISRFDGSRLDLSSYAGIDENTESMTSEQKKAFYKDRIDKELKIKIGSENLLEALNAKNPKQNKEQRRFVEDELNSTNRRIAKLKLELEIESKKAVDSSPASKYGVNVFGSNAYRSDSRAGFSESETANEPDVETESPTFLLAELLQALESENMTPDYYVNHANELVSLFKRHPTLKYDLAWSIFGLRMQMLLLSDVREVIASGYRLLRHAITDRKSLQTIRELNTDYLVLVSLVKDAKASVEREQALKFVRAFLDIKEGVHEIAVGIVRILVAIAEHHDDRLRPLCVMTLAEMLVRHPQLVVSSGGIGVLADAMGDGTYPAADSLTASFLHLLDFPSRRRLLRSGFELSMPFATFTEPPPTHNFDEKLRSSSRVVLSLFQSWPGLTTLTAHGYLPVRSLVSSLYVNNLSVLTVVLDLFFEILRIRPPSWSSSFLAGRRLTTYNRVGNMRAPEAKGPQGAKSSESAEEKISLLDHFTAIVLAILLKCGLMQALLHAEREAPNQGLKRKTTLLISEILSLANQLLPESWSAQLQTLPELFSNATAFGSDSRFEAVAAVYQVDSVNRTLYKSQPAGQPVATLQKSNSVSIPSWAPQKAAESVKLQLSPSMDETQFRNLMLESQVLASVNFAKWDWDLISAMIDGPLTNPRRLDEAIRATKWIHRLLGFLRPFKHRFADIRNTRGNQRYVRIMCNLIRVLIQSSEGCKYLAENKVIPQIAECLAQWDPMSGIMSSDPVFSSSRLTDTLTCGYFAILGVLSSEPRGLAILESRKVINMFYHLVGLADRDDLITLILSNLDYARDSHPRIILAKALVGSNKAVRILATRILRRYAMLPMGECAAWAIRLLVAQLYDTEIAVCEVAIKALEEAASTSSAGLEYVVKCRPALDHLGEIGAPLLLRFLSSSVGYHYLDGLDYITREMDDWFLGRNDSYVALVEASLARGLGGYAEPRPTRAIGLTGAAAAAAAAVAAAGVEDSLTNIDFGTVPPHFYKELTRTAEGCALLRAKGHFEEFMNTIIDFHMDTEDPESILKLKGCLWAVGNVGSMDLGSPFLDSGGGGAAGQMDVTSKIIQIAEQSEVMTVRGTAFFVLGLISRSVHGQEILAERGWDATVNVSGRSMGYCLPLDISKLFAIDGRAAKTDQPDVRVLKGGGVGGEQGRPAVGDDDPVNNEILNAVSRLGNAILWNKTAAELNGFKMRKAPGLHTAALFRKVTSVLAAHHFRLGACRFIIDLFDKEVMRKVVLQEPDSDEEDSA